LLISDYLTCEFHTLVHVLGVSKRAAKFVHAFARKQCPKKIKEIFFNKS